MIKTELCVSLLMTLLRPEEPQNTHTHPHLTDCSCVRKWISPLELTQEMRSGLLGKCFSYYSRMILSLLDACHDDQELIEKIVLSQTAIIIWWREEETRAVGVCLFG